MVNPTPNWQYPQAPPPHGAAPGAPPALPGPMRRAVTLMWAGAVLSVVYSIVNNLITVHVPDNTNHAAFVVGEVVEALLQVTLWLWMLWKVREGRPWARVLSTVFFGFTCLQLLLVLALGGGASEIVMMVYFVVALAALVRLYQRESSAFFSAAKLARYSYVQPGYGQPWYGQPPQPYGGPPEYGGPQPPSST